MWKTSQTFAYVGKTVCFICNPQPLLLPNDVRHQPFRKMYKKTATVFSMSQPLETMAVIQSISEALIDSFS